MNYDGIILDVDGTIWNTTPIVSEAWNLAISKNFPQVPPVTPQILQTQFGKTMEVIADNLFSVLTKEEKHILMEKCCEEEQIALSANTKDISYDKVVETIKSLSKEYKVFIVSNCQSGYIELVINKLGLEPYITDFECYGDTLKNKDENIKLIVERNNLKTPVYVGDTQGDYDACKKAGVPFIFAAYGFGKTDDTDYVGKIDHFSDIYNLLK